MTNLGTGDRLFIYVLLSALCCVFLPFKTFLVWLVITATAGLCSYQFGKRELTNMDLDFVRAVCVKQFSSFSDRIFINESESISTKDNFLRNILGSLKGEEWKNVRNIITPAFNSSKLRKVIPTFNESAKKSFFIFDRHAFSGQKLDIEKIIRKIGMDIIGQAGFSADIGAFKESESPFIENSKNIFEGILTGWKPFFFAFFPYLNATFENWFKIDMMHNSSHEFFHNFLNNLYEKRKAETAQEREMHNDTFQFLMDTVEVEEEYTKDTKTSKKTMSKHKLISQGFLIFVAGYDTTNVVTLFALYMLALHPKIQQKLKHEIDEVVGDDEDITYEHMQKLSYLNQIIQETSRMYPLITRLNRVCTEDVTIQGIHFRKGDLFNIPVYAIQHNPEFYPNPEIFDPERFSPENKASRDPLTFLAFGYGPRSCIGMRFAEMQMRVVIASIIKHYCLERADNSMDMPLKVICQDFIKPAETVYINVRKR